MFPTSIEWDSPDVSTSGMKRAPERSFSSISMFHDESASSLPAHPQTPDESLPVNRLSLTPNSRDECHGVSSDGHIQEMIEYRPLNLSPSSMGGMLDEDCQPRSRQEAFAHLRQLSALSEDSQADTSLDTSNGSASTGKVSHTERSKLIRRKSSEIRRKLFRGNREKSVRSIVL